MSLSVVACRLLFDVSCLLSGCRRCHGRLFFVVCNVLRVGRCVLRVVCCFLCCMVFDVRCGLCDVRCLMFVVLYMCIISGCCLLLAVLLLLF